eukprot:gnl/TRDRNA2_/TRDRNA2_82788_c0_seq2.p1 gnl/TRDRNA2_/TRDRNA2_82788_c0~~gnl/TRDRNA2_/TRDRNA2_82788_c0_seq2.p1  ORF type:complete len:350 (+),score=71.36 gnl/TRDRNA2_/TRDRNA2_82788_c0_seq2:97-1146(+)
MADDALRSRIAETKLAVSDKKPFAEDELDSAIKSLQNLSEGLPHPPNWPTMRDLLRGSAHERHTDWANTEKAAQAFASFLSGPDDAAFCRIFERVLLGGGWDSAAGAANARAPDAKPWVVLVMGLNGIRKTTTVYQRWFKDVLFQALDEKIAKDDLPDGSNSFFRQLDYLVATVANEDSIFARYRTIAEIWGALLVKEAKKKRMNVMVETSGKDIGSFHYVDHFFSDEEYRKLVVHFTINDITLAETSVDRRMAKEMKDGREAIAQAADVREVVKANAGGPYGSSVLRKVQAESDKVWDSLHGSDVGKTWLKASIAITGSASADWTACAAGVESPEAGSCRDTFTFAPL